MHLLPEQIMVHLLMHRVSFGREKNALIILCAWLVLIASSCVRWSFGTICLLLPIPARTCHDRTTPPVLLVGWTLSNGVCFPVKFHQSGVSWSAVVDSPHGAAWIGVLRRPLPGAVRLWFSQSNSSIGANQANFNQKII